MNIKISEHAAKRMDPNKGHQWEKMVFRFKLGNGDTYHLLSEEVKHVQRTY